MTRPSLALLLSVAVLAALPASAFATEVAVSGGELVITGGSDYTDADVSHSGGSVTVFDWGETIDAGAGCSETPPSPGGLLGEEPPSYECEGVTTGIRFDGSDASDYLVVATTLPVDLHGAGGRDYLHVSGGGGVVDGGDGDDTVASSRSGSPLLRGGAGDDELHGGSGDDRLEGGEGDDFLLGDLGSDYGYPPEEAPAGEPPAVRPEGGKDVLDGGPGRDRIDGGGGADVMNGGDGRDTLVYGGRAPVSVSLNDIADDGGPSEGDAVSGFETLQTGDGDDTAIGDARSNTIETHLGNDRIDPGAGPDVIDAGEGDDTIAARDGAQDDINCGEGADTVTADLDDFVDADCETVGRAALPVVSNAPAAPTLKVTARWKRGTLFVRGAVVVPTGVATTACAGGGVTVTIAGVKRRPVSRGTTASARCAFSVRMRVAKRRRAKVRVSASFAGTPAIGGAASAPAKISRG